MYTQERIEKLKLLVKKYVDNISEYKNINYNETEVRNDFVNPFFELLGWDINNKKVLPQHLREVKHEASVIVNQDGLKKKKKPDYSFRIGGETKFFLETKKPNIDVTVNKDSVFQLRRYGWSGNLKVSVLTNFNDLIIYDCSLRPSEGDDVSKGIIAKYSVYEYIDKFDEIYRMLSKEAVLNGNFDNFFEKISSSYKKEPFDSYFLKQIKNWRNLIAQDIMYNNLLTDECELNIFVQKLMNRILFIRICEDRNIEEYETLKNVATYDELKKIFIKADKKYDSGLFELIDEEEIIVSDNVLIKIFLELYYPNSSYEFSVVDAYIIGQIYELFLDEEIKIDNNQVIVVKKPEVVYSQGVVNTPKYIADIIIKETLDSVFKGKKIEDIEKIRIADICCGSGVFLLSAYEYIINLYIEKYVTENEKEAIYRGDIYKSCNNQNYILSFKIKRKILENNLFGVDIDILAVEVAKFGLLLKSIEDASKEEIDAFISINKKRVLPNIDENIKNGNSLIDSDYANFNEKFVLDFRLLNKIKIFDWNDEFFESFKGDKFDAIIGNPPYIRIQNLAKYSLEEYEFYKSENSPYSTAKAELLDKYYLFIERSLTLVKDTGYIGYIIPHKFMLIEAGEELRRLLSINKYVKKIIHFKSNQIFIGKSTYTCIIVISKEKNKNFEIDFVENLTEFVNNKLLNFKTYSTDFLTEKPWVFLSDEVTNSLEKIKFKCEPLKNFADVFVGLQTSNDAFYIIEAKKEDDKFVYFRDFEGIDRRIEKDVLKECIYDVKLNKYKEILSNRYIIYPYTIVNNKCKLYTINEVKNTFPQCFEYLLKYKNILDKRSIKKRDETNWHQFGRSQSLKKFIGKEHLIWPVLSTEANYVYDKKSIAFTGGGNGPYYGLEIKDSTKESIFYIQAILNHEFIETIVKNKASTFRGNYYSHGKQFIEDLPIRKIDFSNAQEKAIYDNIVRSVCNIMDMYIEIEKKKNKTTKTIILRAIKIEKKIIEQSINTLYEI